ncbi:helix-turn-helix domain-containing protein [Solirubrobacter phytolaccae]|uniref:Helix-turn-helix domain-containing protein n=1 Tax=Solirubrobacter phytolaccae TaxID=1404360 RepID=A0A9X3N6N9_9ACTN|nr:helix-turn-helix transcriptional regulator [Solirubrobacter phytolaccae]MDA0179317.1 helix-turn-helix domain-containing protein [Solirubrobacter phytolaccae]
MLAPPTALFQLSRRLTNETQERLGEVLGISASQVCRLERGGQVVSPTRWKEMLPRFAIGTRADDEELPLHILFELTPSGYRLVSVPGCLGVFADWQLALAVAALLDCLSPFTVVAHPVWLDAAMGWTDSSETGPDQLVLIDEQGQAPESVVHRATREPAATYVSGLLQSLPSRS